MKYSYFFVLVIFLLAVSCKNSGRKEKLVIATAANMQFAMDEVTEAFSRQSGIETEIILGSSGTLTAQIMAGAPYDIFLSANLQYPEHLYKQGLGYRPPETYAYGQLVLWTCKEGIEPSLETLRQEQVSHIAIPNPQVAPYGRAAKEVLMQKGLYNEVASKLVYGESISQTNQFIRTGAAEIGFTALSVVLSEQVRGTGSWLKLPQSTYSSIAQGVLILDKDTQQLNNAIKFHNFLKSEKARQILEKYGYLKADE
ncbi:molybdate ABC transporter substrate-binding protein [Lentiprolixibacter aurantiacus]|uniref:Molybdate ABC transporter substrate-binding protein n=1 Tax=Lentiprolixibacter aurantiacus TaxID=2993939 RepID=A0AAE3MNB1_9FLAO|nr:molybdate ABC transporter substrate-binding protein [Lentiprolixibacter aurantiacus]MCX2720024.1 molybdate ABC transporter substrate-binding protein [Lentiprolixibacter aurantiacus]